MANPNSTFDQTLSAASYKYMAEGGFKDNIHTGAHLLAIYKKYGGIKPVDGGHSLTVPLEYALNNTVRSSNAWEEVSFTETNEFTSVNYGWKQIDGTLSISQMDIAQNAGESRVVDLMKAKISSLERSIRQNFNGQLYNGTLTESKNINGLIQLVAATGTVGGIDSGTETWWRSSVTTGSTALTVAVMETAFHNCFYDEAADVIVTTQTLFEKYMDLNLSKVSLNKPDARIAELGFDSATFKGKPLVWDRDCPSTHLYYLNFNGIKLCPHKMFDFKVSEAIKLQKQHVIGHTVLWIGNQIATARRLNARLQGFTA